MSIEKHFEKRGVELTEDNSLPQGKRTQKNVKRIIAAVRAAEAEFNDSLEDANERCREAQGEVIALQQKCHALENQVRRYKVAEELGKLSVLADDDKTRLLEVA